MDKIMEYAPTALACLGGLVTILMAVTPLTPTKWDDKVLAMLQRVLAAVKLVKQQPAAK
jgi:hypothetical protein